MLSIDVKTTAELLSIALAAERMATARYTRLAAAMHEYGNPEAAALFERMIEEERGHEQVIEEWAKLEGVSLSNDIGRISWEDPQVRTDYDGDAVDPAHSTPYRALAFAVHNEERAFHFYAHVAATSDDSTLCAFAETLAREELGHAALLRSMRRRAWHAERESGLEEPNIDPAIIHSCADLLAIASSAEHCLASYLNILSASHPDLAAAHEHTLGVIADTDAQLHAVGSPNEDAVDAVAAITSHKQQHSALSNDPAALLKRLRVDSDRCFTLYDTVATQAEDEGLMLTAQALSEYALERIGLLRESK